MAHHNLQRLNAAAPPLSEFPPLHAGSPPDPAMFPPPASAGLPRPRIPNGKEQSQQRHSGEFRPQHTNGHKPIPAGPNGPPPHRQSAFGGPAFEGARSPPNPKNTSHVPCKFFKQGQCQAGTACPFSHSLDSSKFEQPCKYFSKGNCKFGQKCALLHVLPNGRIVNRGSAGMGHLNIGNRVDPPLYHHQQSALGNSLMSTEGPTNQPFGHQIPSIPDLSPSHHPTPHAQPFDVPRSDDRFGAALRDDSREPKSPPKNLAEAQLPASFDSNGYSYMAMFGPVAASVPTKLAYESPPPSLPTKANVPADILRNLHDSAFPTPTSNRAALGSSPSSTAVEPPSTRVMHSQRVSKPRMISSSVPHRPAFADDSDDNFSDGAGEEYVPNALSDLLTPDERHRRSSGKVDDPIAIRGALTSHPSHGHGDVTNFGSPPAAVSPSRFAGLFNKSKDDPNAGGFNATVGSPPFRASASHLSPSLRPSQRSAGSPGDFSSSPFSLSSPPRTGLLSQQLKRVNLAGGDAGASGASSPGSLHPPMVTSGRYASNPRSSFERNVSGAPTVNANRIEEEPDEFVFSLDDVEDGGMGKSPGNQKSPLGSVGDGRLGVGKTMGKNPKP